MQSHGVRPPSRPRPLIIGLVLLLGLTMAGTVGIHVMFDAYTIPSRAMEPTLEPGDRVLARPLGGRHPQRGDLVVFEPPPSALPAGGLPVTRLISRVVAVGGDRIGIANGRLTVNDEVVDESYLAAGTTTDRLASTRVPADSIYVLGDNRGNALDSRSYGAVHADGVHARVTFTNLPLDWISLGAVVLVGFTLGLVLLRPVTRLRSLHAPARTSHASSAAGDAQTSLPGAVSRRTPESRRSPCGGHDNGT